MTNNEKLVREVLTELMKPEGRVMLAWRGEGTVKRQQIRLGENGALLEVLGNGSWLTFDVQSYQWLEWTPYRAPYQQFGETVVNANQRVILDSKAPPGTKVRYELNEIQVDKSITPP